MICHYSAVLPFVRQLPGENKLADAVDEMSAIIHKKLAVFCMLRAQEIAAER